MEIQRERGEMRGEEIVDRDRRRQEEQRWGMIRESRYNRWYGAVKGEGVPGYLKRGGGE